MKDMDSITSAKNPLIKSMKALRERKGRQAQRRFLVEGDVMIREALQCGLSVHDALFTEAHGDFAAFLSEKGACVHQVPPELLKSVCDTLTPQGICAAFDWPDPLPVEDVPKLIVALDGVQDPGNLGTIWRTADAAGFGALLLGTGCADPLSPKVQRAAMGSGFRVPFMFSENLSETLSVLKKRSYRVVVSDLRGEDFYNRPSPGDAFALVIGNEAHGVSEAVRQVADMRLKLPMRGGAESLNAAVAAGILMYGLTEVRQ